MELEKPRVCSISCTVMASSLSRVAFAREEAHRLKLLSSGRLEA